MRKLLMVLSLLIGVNTFGDGFKIGLGGYCPVGFVKAGKQVFGSPQFASEYNGTTYYNSSPEAKAMFDKEPNVYVNAIKYVGYCATGVSMGKKLESDPSHFSQSGGNVYFFSSKEAKAMFDKEPAKFIAKADVEWTKLSKK